MKHQAAFMRSSIVLISILSNACARDGGSSLSEAEALARGKELVSVGGCGHCHTPMIFDETIGMPVPDAARKLSGHPADVGDPEARPGGQDQAVIGSTFTSFRAPFGVVYAANLTPDVETGLGAWTPEEFIATMRTGHRKGSGRSCFLRCRGKTSPASPTATCGRSSDT